MVFHGPAPNALDYFANIGESVVETYYHRKMPSNIFIVPDGFNVIIVTCVPGFPCEPHNNPADFFLDVINGDSTATTMTKVHSSEGNVIHKYLHEN